jgi:MYXO-CTERM domain-containing protein
MNQLHFRQLRHLAGGALLASGFFTSSASACGGFFCNNATPVNQAAERIIFAQEGENVTQIVEVMYEGEAEKFSWVLPVPGIPVPGVSSVQAFDRLQQATNPTYSLQARFPEGCGFPGSGGSSALAPGNDGVDIGGEAEGPRVTVVDSGSVGPFDYETITVDAADQDPADVAVRWLEENGYDVGPMGREVLGPYLANGLNLIAFRLQKGKSAGAIRPISLQYEASAMAIPIRPTAVAAAPDMPILVWVLGADRAVPTNYRGLEINELLIDWFNPSATYNRVVIAAANEAGGQGFVTEFAGDAGQYVMTISPVWERELLTAYTAADPIENVLVGVGQQFAGYDGFLEVIAEHLPLREGITAELFASCPYCYFYPASAPGLGFGETPEMLFDERIAETDPIFAMNVEEFLNATQVDVLSPIEATAGLFADHPYLTRLYTTMSADEMSVDPIFEFNPDLEEVSSAHVADQLMGCEDDSWVVTLENGQKVAGNGREWPHSLDNTDLPFNVRILQYSTSGLPEVIDDNVATIQTIHNDTPAGDVSPVTFEDGSAGGGLCAVPQNPAPSARYAWLVPFALGGLLLARRRRNAPVPVRKD